MRAFKDFGSRRARWRTAHRLRGLLPSAAGVFMGMASAAHAQWTVTNLHPGWASTSYVYGGFGGNQVGAVLVGEDGGAAMWSGSAASYVDLNPDAFAIGSTAFGAADGRQAGQARVNGLLHASLWSGTAESWVDLHPEALHISQIFACSGPESGGQQVGITILSESDHNHAALWSGTAESWVDLHPAAARRSTAYGVSNGRQVGAVAMGSGMDHASLWSGSPASWVDLGPAGATLSLARAVSGGRQVGYASFAAGVSHAGLWRGTAASWVDLNPAGATNSDAFGTAGDLQAGIAIVNRAYHAGVWRGTAASWVDLHAVLPAEFHQTTALCMWADAGRTYVGGFGFNTATSRNEALVWSRVSPCAADFNYDESVNLGDVLAFLAAFAAGDLRCDVDDNAQVNIQDFLRFLAEYASLC